MHKKFNRGDNKTIQQKLAERNLLLKIFMVNSNRPVLVHSTPKERDFLKIISESELKIPKKNIHLEHLYIEKLLKLYPSIFLSLGFVYSTSYNFKYSLIFDLSLLKKAKYYQKSIGFQCYREAFRFWEENSPEYVKKLRNKNKTCKGVVDKYYNQEYNGKRRTIFEFWKIEKDLIDLIENYPKKKELIKIFKDIAKQKYVSYPKSIKSAKKDCLKEYAPEIIVMKDISLSNNKQFLGFYIRGKVPKKIKSLLKKDYSDKIFFDGKKAPKILDM
tara:strand:+ start:61 stop:879 length:819 start_codon:yes stop_codon:yes gene_type:complete